MLTHRPVPSFARTLAAATFLVALSGCARKPASPENPSAGNSEKAGVVMRDYRLAGVVRAVDPGAGRVTIRHEAVPGFMPAMTMEFTPRNRADLDDVRPGDEVEGTLRVESRGGDVTDYALIDLVVARPATPTPLALNLSGDRPPVGPAPERLKPGEEVPDFAMTDQDGKPLRLSDLRGRVVVLTFIFTRCPLPDFCPRMDRKFSELADRVSASPGRAEQVRLLSVSFDPEHDTPAVLKGHARVLGAKPPLWTFAVASHAELARVARPLGLVYGPVAGGVNHNLVTAVIDPGGRLARLETGSAARGWETADLLRSMYSCLARTKK